MGRSSPYAVRFYEDEHGHSPVERWLLEELTSSQRRSVAAALRELVAEMGQDICRTEFGKHLGEGLVELRLRQVADQISRRMGKSVPEPHPEDASESILLRIFFHPHGQKQVLVLHGYDKGANASKRYQQTQIAIARKRLAAWEKNERAKTRKEAKRGR